MSATDEEKTAITQSFNHEVGGEEANLSFFQKIPKRYILAMMAFLGFANVYALRVNLSVAIVAMVRPHPAIVNGTSVNISEFDWDTRTQGHVLAAFFWGYIFTQIPGGLLAKVIGGKYLFGGGIVATGILTLLTPSVARCNVYLLVVLRVLEGLFEGVTYPVMHMVWSKWAPPDQRSKLITFAFSGAYFGTVISLPLSGVIAETLGWQWVFYIFGLVAIVWFMAWVVVIHESPSLHPTITKAELHYIQTSVGFTEEQGKVQPVPWKQIFMSLPVWAIIVAHFCENWGFYTMLTELPTFLHDVMQYDLYKAGFLSAIPYAVMCVAVQVGGQLADLVRTRGHLSTTNTRKLFNSVAFVWQLLFLVGVAYTMTPVAAIVCISMAVGLGGFAWSGFSVNHLDLAPQFSSVLMGISNTAATLSGIISPTLTGYIVQDKTIEEWRIVFYLAAGIYGVGAIVYTLFASGDLQPWAEIPLGYIPHENTPEPDQDDKEQQP